MNEHRCDVCGGSGKVPIEDRPGRLKATLALTECIRCLGTGKLYAMTDALFLKVAPIICGSGAQYCSRCAAAWCHDNTTPSALFKKLGVKPQTTDPRELRQVNVRTVEKPPAQNCRASLHPVVDEALKEVHVHLCTLGENGSPCPLCQSATDERLACDEIAKRHAVKEIKPRPRKLSALMHALRQVNTRCVDKRNKNAIKLSKWLDALQDVVLHLVGRELRDE
jgi:hypothetical protein